MELSGLRIAHLLLVTCFLFQLSSSQTTEDEAAQFMDDLDKSYSYECNLEMEANWAYMTDVENVEAESAANDASVRYFTFQSEAALNVSTYEYESFEDVDLYREFRFQADQGPGGLAEEDLQLYQTLQSTMENIYSTATICPYDDQNEDPEICTLALEPDLEDIMATSTDFEELKYVWEQWREVSGKLMRENYTEFVALSNNASTNDGYDNTGDYWLNWYTVTAKESAYFGDGNLVEIDQEKFKTMVDDVWTDVFESLYKPLHAYVRLRLKDLYPEYIELNKPIPANVLGNMWAQDWTNIGQYVMPFQDQPDYDVTQSMIDNGWDINKMFLEAEGFFTSIGLYEMTDDFWEKSVINQTAWGKNIICHASAEDFCLGPNSTDFRIKMCTDVNMNDLITVHHEMGHIEYFMAYRDQPHVFRDSANPGFHEAIGDLIALSVSTPTHMEDILGLTPSVPDTQIRATSYTVDEQRDLNFLMRMALEKIAFLPFGYLIDKYRWGVFDGSIDSDSLNSEWWNLREGLQGVSPPSRVKRGEEYFDPGAKYHVPANVPYIRYFVSFIVQFQFHKKLCTAINFDGPLYQCDIYNRLEAGQILESAMMKGFSEPWPVVLNELGGSYAMSADAIKEFFQPLTDYLNEELKGVYIGWQVENSLDELASTLLHQMEDNITHYVVDLTDASWVYNTNVTDENANAVNIASVEFSTVYREWWNKLISKFPYDSLTYFYKRQFLMQQSIGTAILEEGQLTQLNEHLTAMITDYGNKVCPFDDMKCDEGTEGYDIDRLELVMAEESGYTELLYYWEKWRDVSGKKMLDDFEAYVDLMNIAAFNNSFADAGEMWIEPYTTYGSDEYLTEDFKANIDALMNDIKPYYEKLHAYVRYKLQQIDEYNKYFYSDDLIPAHILGNMWAQSWENIYDKVAPYPDVPLLDISNILEEKSNVDQMFRIAEDFYTGLGLYNMTRDFWNQSLFVQPTDGREVVCHASAWDFYSTEIDNTMDGRFRIKMCTNTNQEDFIVIHHEMGHIEYYMSYSNDMPLIFRDGANPGFHEAIGDTIALAVSTPNHLNMIQNYINSSSGNIKLEKIQKAESNLTIEEMQNINYLMKQALAKIPFLPYAYILDSWRWEVFEGNITRGNYNEQWWKKRIDLQGLRPPIDRSPNLDFDIGCKYHVPANVPYIRYFVAYILQFQFYEKLCEISGHTEDLFNCDFYNNKDAGSALLSMLSNGASIPWQEQLAVFLETDTGEMDSAAIIAYFDPLWKFLDSEIEALGITPGWSTSDDVLGDYMSNAEEISAVVPIIVGIVLAVLVCIVLIAFFIGQRKRKRQLQDKEKGPTDGKVNAGLELDDKERELGHRKNSKTSYN